MRKVRGNSGVHAIEQISFIPKMLKTIQGITGMGFVALARVTKDEWTACEVFDTINFGLKRGEGLEVQTTICHEILHSHQFVAFDNAETDPVYRDHHTVRIYGIKSYISIPVYMEDGRFFGTLCAVDREAGNVNNEKVINLFELFSQLVSSKLTSIELLEKNEYELVRQKNVSIALREEIKAKIKELERTTKDLDEHGLRLLESSSIIRKQDETIEKMSREIQSFSYVTSHDLQEPLRKIQLFCEAIYEKEKDKLNPESLFYFERIVNAATRLRALMSDLLSLSEHSKDLHVFESCKLDELIELVKTDLQTEITETNARIETLVSCEIQAIPFQIRQMFFSLFTNALKFIKAGEYPQIRISSECGKGREMKHPALKPDWDYCHITFSDQGIGFDQRFAERIFRMFERLKDDKLIKGTGMGLTIVKRIVDNHDGVITAHGIPDGGASFEIFLPIRQDV